MNIDKDLIKATLAIVLFFTPLIIFHPDLSDVQTPEDMYNALELYVRKLLLIGIILSTIMTITIGIEERKRNKKKKESKESSKQTNQWI